MITAITGARVFDGTQLLPPTTILLERDRITSVGGTPPAGADIVDGSGGTVLPGLIDAHVHSDDESLAIALTFGVTTALEMQGTHTRNDRHELTEDDRFADVRSAGFGLTPPGGHPSELFPPDFRPGPAPGTTPPKRNDPIIRPDVSTPEAAAASVRELAAAGSDYIKFMIDDGTVAGHPGLPCLDQATLNAGVVAAHDLGLLTVAHALTIEGAQMAVDAGIDGLAHLFMDRPHTPEIINAIAGAGMFVTACVVLDASMIGIGGGELADDPRVAARLTPEWDATLRASIGHYPQGSLRDVLDSVAALHAAGVDILVGTDVSVPFAFLGGMAPGASVHHELRYLVQAGLTPTAALASATSVTARRFGLADRGVIEAGRRADLLLVDGDPTEDIDRTLDIRGVWRRGTRLRANS